MTYKYSCKSCNFKTNNNKLYKKHSHDNPDIIIYILYFDDKSKKIAEDDFNSYNWAKPIFIKSTPYLESIMYTEVLDNIKDEWKDKKYVGTMSYKAKSKIDIPENILDTKNNDVVGFHDFNTVNQSNNLLLRHAMSNHVDFLPIWISLLSKLGYTPFQYANKLLPTLFCNYWYCKVELMFKFIDFMKKVKYEMENDNILKNSLFIDSKYISGTLTPQECMQKFGVSYYPYHPFICERLAGFYFYSIGASILPNCNINK